MHNDKTQNNQIPRMMQFLCDIPIIQVINLRYRKQQISNNLISEEWQLLEEDTILKQQQVLKQSMKSNNTNSITSLNIELNIDYELEFQIQCLNNKSNYYSKHKSENDLSWWVILGIPIISKLISNQKQQPVLTTSINNNNSTDNNNNNNCVSNKIHHTNYSMIMKESYMHGELLVLKRIGILSINKITTTSLAFKISSKLLDKESSILGIDHLLLYITCNSIHGIDNILKIPITIQNI